MPPSRPWVGEFLLCICGAGAKFPVESSCLSFTFYIKGRVPTPFSVPLLTQIPEPLLTHPTSCTPHPPALWISQPCATRPNPAELVQRDRLRGLVTLEEERRGSGRGASHRQNDRLADLSLAPLGGSPFASLGPARGEAQQVERRGGGERRAPACSLPQLHLLSAFGSLSDSF